MLTAPLVDGSWRGANIPAIGGGWLGKMVPSALAPATLVVRGEGEGNTVEVLAALGLSPEGPR